MFSKFSIKIKLYALLCLMLALVAFTAVSEISNLHKDNAVLKSLNENQILPLKDLKTTADNIGWNVMDLARRANSETIPGPKASEEIIVVYKSANEAWSRYIAAEMTTEEAKIASEAKEQFKKVDAAVTTLTDKLKANDTTNLQDFLDHSLQASIAPLMVSLDKLAKIQTDVVAETMQNQENNFTKTLYTLVASIAIAGTLVSVFALLLIRAITKKLGTAANVAEQVAAGNLAVQIDATGNDEISAVLKSLEKMVGNLSGLVSQVRASSDSIATGATQVTAGSLDLSQRTEKQAAALQETAATLEQLTATVKQNAGNAQTANQLASSASGSAKKGGEMVQEVVASMSKINEASAKIQDIVTLIDSLTFQTNILALNAAIEAARAGEQGRGFSVVAGEVRSLSHRCAEAASEIKSLVTENIQHVSAGAELVSKAGASVTEIITQVDRMSDLVAEISEASKEQANGIGQVNIAVSELDQATQQNAALVEESTAAAESLNQQAGSLVDLVSTFKLPSQGVLAVATVGSVAKKSKPRATATVAAKTSTIAPATPKFTPAPVKISPAVHKPVIEKPNKSVDATAESDWESF